MTYLLQVALRYLSARPMPPRCHACQRYIFGGWYSERVGEETRMWHTACNPDKDPA